jgi:chromosome segregation ATPase
LTAPDPSRDTFRVLIALLFVMTVALFSFGRSAQGAHEQLSAAKAAASAATSRALKAEEVAAVAVIEAGELAAKAAQAETAAQTAQREAQRARQRVAALAPAPDTCQPYIALLEVSYALSEQRGDSLQLAVDLLQEANDTLQTAVDSLAPSLAEARAAIDSLTRAADRVDRVNRPGWFRRLLPQRYVGVEAGIDLLTRQPAVVAGIGLGWSF